MVCNSTAAFKKFLPKLQNHLLERLISREFDGDMNSQIQNKTQYVFLDENFILFKHATSITPATTYSSYVTSSTLIHTLILCCALLLMRKMLNSTDMQECLESIMPTFELRIRQYLAPETSGAWIFFGSVGLVRSQAIIQDFVKQACPKLAL